MTTPTKVKSENIDGIQSSAGPADAGKIPALNNEGVLDPTITGFSVNFQLGETISSTGVVSLMPDGKVYKLTNNKRTMTGAVAGETATKSCLFNGGTKIATLGRTGNTLKLYIGTIDYNTNTITYGTGVQVTLNATSSVFLVVDAGTDLLAIAYSDGSNYYGRAITVSTTTPTIGIETLVYAGVNSSVLACKIRNGAVAFGIKIGTLSTTKICSVVTTTLTIGAGDTGGGYNNSLWLNAMYYVAENIYIIGWGNSSGAESSSIQLISVSGTTPTVGTDTGIGNYSHLGPTIVTDGTSIYALHAAYDGSSFINSYLKKYTYSGNTLTLAWSATPYLIRTNDPPKIFLLGGMIGYVSGTSIVWNSIEGGIIVQKNTIDYGIDLSQTLNYYSTNYSMVGLTSNPSTLYKVSNEDRNIIGYLNTTGVGGNSKPVTMNGGVVSGLSLLIPGVKYYAITATGALGTGGVVSMGKALSATQLQLNIDNLA